jgi:hypothetical protein
MDVHWRFIAIFLIQNFPKVVPNCPAVDGDLYGAPAKSYRFDPFSFRCQQQLQPIKTGASQ